MKRKTIGQIKVGEKASHEMVITEQNVETFGEITADYNPMHFDEDYAAATMFKKRISHGMYVGSLFSKLIGMDLPGEGSIYVSQTLRFRRPVFLGDTITAEIVVQAVDKERNRVYFECTAYNQNNEKVIVGEAEVMPPKAKE